MVMKHKYGDAKMKRFLRYELDALPARAAARSARRSCRCYRNENQGTSTTARAASSMYALQDYIGEDNVNRALAAYIKKVGVPGPAVHHLARAAGRVPRGDAAASTST